MGITASFLNPTFLLLLVAFGVFRATWSVRHYTLFGALGASVLIAFAAPSTFVVIAVITLGWLFPTHRLTSWLRATNRAELARRYLMPISIGTLVAVLIVTKAYRFFTIPGISN